MDESSPADFHHIRNPYIVGNPIRDSKMFFGREDDFEYVKKKFASTDEGGLIVLCGARRSGKTSILFQISGGRLGPEFVPVLIDMQSMAVSNDLGFLTKLGHELITAVGSSDKTLDTFLESSEANPYAAFDDLVRDISSRLGGRRLILMFDEYELFETNIDGGIISTRILNLLGNLIEHKNVFVIFTGSDNLEARDKPYWGIFLSKALHRRISFLTRHDTLRLVQEPLKSVITYDEGIPERIFELTAGQPFYAQVLCQNTVDRLNDQRLYRVVHEDIDEVISEIIDNPLPQMIFNWNALDDLEKVSLSVIAELSRDKVSPVHPKDINDYLRRENIGYRMEPGELNKSLENLFHCDLLAKQAGKGIYTFKMDLWRSWVTRMHSVWQVLDELERSGGTLAAKGLIPEDVARRRRLRLILVVALLSVAVTITGSYLFTRRFGYSGMAAPDMGPVSLETDPPNATVWIDGELAGMSPIVDLNLPAGKRFVRIELDGHRSLLDSILIEKDKAVELQYQLAEAMGGLLVRSQPAGAEIRIDGRALGDKSPARIERLAAGGHEVTFVLPDYETLTRTVEVPEDSTVVLTATLVKKQGALSVVSDPVGADVYLDGRQVGTTPHVEPAVDYGRHVVRIVKEGYNTYEHEITVSSPNQKIEGVSLGLLPPGKVVFSIQPYAAILIDGELIGEDITYSEVALAPGDHAIILRHPQLGSFSRTIHIEPNESVTVEHRFSAAR